MAYKPDKYHQTDPPCELKSAVMGRKNSRKKSEAKEETKPASGSLSGAATCSAVVPSKRAVLCCFCGKSWDYTGEQAPEELFQEAVDHEKVCEKNPYTSQIIQLLQRVSELESVITASRQWGIHSKGYDADQSGENARTADELLLQNVKHTSREQ